MLKKIFRIVAPAAVLVLMIFLASSPGTPDSSSQGRLDRLSTTISAQAFPQALPSPLWARTYGLFFGGPAFSSGEADYAHAVQPMGDGNFIVAGAAVSTGPQDAYHLDAVVMELNSQGNVKWKALCPSDLASPFQCEAVAAVPTRDGGCLAVGQVWDTIGQRALVMSLGQDGGVRWIKSYWLEDRNCAIAVVPTRDGGYAVAADTSVTNPDGNPESGIWVFKLDQGGTVLWSELFISGWAYESVRAIQEVADGGLVLAGTHEESGYKRYEGRTWILRLTCGGGLEWHKCYAATPGVNESGTKAQGLTLTKDGGFALAGSVQLPASNPKAWVCKLNSSGDIKWQRTYNGRSASAIIQTSDGGYLVTGGDPARAFKLTSSGAVQWAKKYERSLKSREMLGVFEKRGGGYVMIARSDPLSLVPGFWYTPWIVISADKNGDVAPECPFVRSIVGDVRTPTGRVVPDSFTMTALAPHVSTLSFSSHAWPSVRVGHNVCSK